MIKKLLIAVVIIILGIVIFKNCEKEVSVSPVDTLTSKIDSIYVIKDSILEEIDTVYVKLEENKKQYEKNFNRIINHTVSEDYVFFHKYIESNKSRLDSISNSL